jgi:hypothetical protein
MERQADVATNSREAVWCAVALAAWSFVVLFQAGTAHAASLHNKDGVTYKVEVMVKSARRLHELAPGEAMRGFCEEGCIIRLNESADNDYELEGSERVSIEGGLVYYDGEEVGNANSRKKPK